MSTTTSTPASTRAPSAVRGVLLSVLLITVVAGIANAVIALAVVAAGASASAPGMIAPAYVTFTLFGGLFGALGWAIVRRAAKNPARLLKILVPVVFVLLLIPAIGMVASAATAGAALAAVGLIVMHFATLGVALPVYRRFLPLSA